MDEAQQTYEERYQYYRAAHPGITVLKAHVEALWDAYETHTLTIEQHSELRDWSVPIMQQREREAGE